MRSIATLLIALMFTGGPVVRGACAVWCDATFPTGVHSCHESAGEAATTTVGVASVACSALVAEAPAVRNDAPSVARVLAVVDWFHTPDFLIEGGRVLYGPFRVDRIGASSAAPLVLRI